MLPVLREAHLDTIEMLYIGLLTEFPLQQMSP